MKKHSSKAVDKKEKPAITVGIDVGDKFSRYCLVKDVEVMEEGRVQCSRSMQSRFTHPG